jgi:hypothetical protein
MNRDLSFPQIKNIVDRLTYKPEMKISVAHDFIENVIYLRLLRKTQCAVTGASDIEIVHNVVLTRVSSTQFLLHIIREAIHRFEMHEADEWLKFDGRPPFYPHDTPYP